MKFLKLTLHCELTDIYLDVAKANSVYTKNEKTFVWFSDTDYACVTESPEEIFKLAGIKVIENKV